ncbi:MAG: hypothetical protein EXR67_05455 [Dehalococcoidia bacterium]|nr:hypothetical protein [Dehalococcoidia bacterium]
MALSNQQTIRSLRSLDLLAFPLKQWRGLTEQSVTLDRLESDVASGPLSTLAKNRVGLTRRSSFWIAQEGSRVHAVVEGKARSGPNAWEIPHLWAGDSALRPVTALLEQVPVEAGKYGARRVFLRLSADSPYIPAAAQAGFVTAFEETLFSKDGRPELGQPAVQHEIRRRSIEHDSALFHAFNLATPATVRCAVGLTLEEWRDSHEQSGHRADEWVYAAQGHQPSGLVQEWSCNGASHVRVVTATSDALEALLQTALPVGSDSRVNLLVPDYLPNLEAQVESLGFAPRRRYVVLVKSVVEMVREVAFAPASV